MAALKKAAGSVPIVFTATIDPVRLGFVESLSRPGGNTTGFINIEYSFCGKWLEKLKGFAPAIRRVAVLRDPTVFSGDAQFAAIQAAAALPEYRAETIPIDVNDAGKIERGIISFAREADGGPHCNGEYVRYTSSRPDHNPGGAPSVARDLSGTLLRNRRWPDFLRARFPRPIQRALPTTSIVF